MVYLCVLSRERGKKGCEGPQVSRKRRRKQSVVTTTVASGSTHVSQICYILGCKRKGKWKRFRVSVWPGRLSRSNA